MPLALIVSLFVLGSIAVVGMAGYLIDKSTDGDSREGR